MFRLLSFVMAMLLSGVTVAQTERFPGIGRAATPAEIKAWDIDVRPDFKGLPKGQGTVAKGQDVWEAKCASCHGIFGESNEVFTPIVGGTTKKDRETGKVAGLISGTEAQRTTMMKLAQVSTLWDYINRAMPWNAPKTLSTEEVYAVTAYILHLGEVLPVDFTLSDQNIAEVQKLLPNRNGLTQSHGLWAVRGKADVKAAACMNNCDGAAKPSSALPDFARNAHGNLMAQQRVIGATRGTDTTRPAPEALDGSKIHAAALQLTASKPPSGAALQASADYTSVKKLANDNACMGCHGVSQRLVGPSFKEIAEKYKGQSQAEAHLTSKIKAGGAGTWGQTPMPPYAQLADADLKALVAWALKGAPQ